MRRRICGVLALLYLFAAFADYLDREGIRKGLWGNILWRDGGLPVLSLAKGLLWPIRLSSIQNRAGSELVEKSAYSTSGQLTADTEMDFLRQICLEGLAKTSMPRNEAVRFCRCVEDDISPQLTYQQRSTIREAQASLSRGEPISPDFFVASGVLDLVIAGEARCEAAFYPPSQPITVKSGKLEMILRCNGETQGPEVFIHIRDGQLLTTNERERIMDRMMNDSFVGDFAIVKLQRDTDSTRSESWAIDLTGRIISALKPHVLLAELRGTSFLKVEISRGEVQYTGRFALADKIPPRWVPCGGVHAK